MSNDVLVKVDNVSKRFCRSLKRSLWYGLQDLGSEIGGRRHGGGSGLPQSSADVPLRPDEFWAVKDVSFELRRGECLGLIGRNGAGKTTLLRMLNGLIKTDTGRIEMKGHIGALIALGAGFNPVLTGRENIHTNAAIMGIGMGRLKRKLDEIVEFSGIEDFIDSPVQSYSSGMTVRLGFAIASSLEFQILLLDEILAVGDEEFQLKCFTKISELISKGDSCAILVTHQMQNVERICSRAIAMKNGSIDLASDNTSQVVDLYTSESMSIDSRNPKITYPPSADFLVRDIRYAPFSCILSISTSLASKESRYPDSMIASYNLSLSGSRILSGTTRGSQKEVCTITDDVISLKIPDQIASLGDLKLSLTFWDAVTNKPQFWIKGIRINPATQDRRDIRITFA